MTKFSSHWSRFVILCTLMKTKLTRLIGDSFDPRDAKHDERIVLTTTSSVERGSQPERAPIEGVFPAAVVWALPGGASESKWTRRTRPWNASMQTTAVSPATLRETWLETEAPRSPEAGVPGDRGAINRRSVPRRPRSHRPPHIPRSLRGHPTVPLPPQALMALRHGRWPGSRGAISDHRRIIDFTGDAQGGPDGQAVRVGSRINGSPVQSASGRGRPRGRLMLWG
jgi:hypothetical protein